MYTAKAALAEHGLAGLVPGKPGPGWPVAAGQRFVSGHTADGTTSKASQIWCCCADGTITSFTIPRGKSASAKTSPSLSHHNV
ncbi:MAG: hypothetical protein ACRDST_08085 [Pseudonocardiaceae bacterium]